MKSIMLIAILFLSQVILACSSETSANASSNTIERGDNAHQLNIALSGSLQNPAFSPDGERILFTRFRDGYNTGVSDLFIYNLVTGELSALIADGSSNVNLPGSVWNKATASIVFSSEKDTHDEIFIIPDTGISGDEQQITNRQDKQAFEPSFSSDGQRIVFESHHINTEDDGVITKYRIDGSSDYIDLTESAQNAKQPNWSPAKDKILYQVLENEQWDIWTMDADGSHKTRVTNFQGSKTDAVFSPDGQGIIFSMENQDVNLANIYRLSLADGNLTRLTHYDGYDGAPSISPDGKRIVFESSPTDPETSAGTSLWILDIENNALLDYKQEMRDFVQEISAYAKSINPDFAIIPQNGVELVTTTGDDTGSPDLNYLSVIDGIGQEDLFYGYDVDDQATPDEENAWITGFLDVAKNNGGVKILVTDYCSTHAKMDDSYASNHAKGYISFAADHRTLDHIPAYPAPTYNENADVITNLQDVQNFLYLINPDNEYPTRQAFVNAVKNTNYDVVIMDFFFDGETFTPDQLAQLRQKANGGKRLLISYMSIGEAEDYRYYWQADWGIGNPPFIDSEDPDWPGNYYVRYWETNWKNIIFGNGQSYLKKILDAGFDGVYLDIIDAFEHFESADPRQYQHGIDFVPLPDETYALVWSSSGNPPTGQLPNGNWTHDIYYSHIDPNRPVIEPVVLISNPEAQEPASAAIAPDGHIFVTMEDGWNTRREVAQRYGVYDAALKPILPYPQLVADGGHSGHVAAAGNHFVVFYSEGWIEGGGVDGLGSGGDVISAIYTSKGDLAYTLDVAVGDSRRDWWPLAAGSPERALLLWQRFVEDETYSRLMFSVLDVANAAWVADAVQLEDEVQYYTYSATFVPAIDRFLVTGAHPDGSGFTYLLDLDGNVAAANLDLPAPVRESQVIIREGRDETLAVEPTAPSGVMVLALTPESIVLKETLKDGFVWPYSGSDGIFLPSGEVYIVATSPEGLVERRFILPGERDYLPIVIR